MKDPSIAKGENQPPSSSTSCEQTPRTPNTHRIESSSKQCKHKVRQKQSVMLATKRSVQRQRVQRFFLVQTTSTKQQTLPRRVHTQACKQADCSKSVRELWGSHRTGARMPVSKEAATLVFLRIRTRIGSHTHPMCAKKQRPARKLKLNKICCNRQPDFSQN